MRLKDKVAIITGAANGMGAAEAKLFAKEGAKVVATDLDEKNLAVLAEEIKTAGGEVLTVKQDVTSEAEWQALISKTIDTYGKLDILVNNAGIAINKNFSNMEMTEWNKVMDVNLNGCVLGMKYCIPEMQKNGSGKQTICFILS